MENKDHLDGSPISSSDNLKPVDKREAIKKYATATAVINGIAAGTTNIILQPFAVLRTTIQSMNVYDHGIKTDRRKIIEILKSFKAGGIRSMYRGCTSSVCLSASGWVVFRFFYDKLSHYELFKDTTKTSVNLTRSATSSLMTSVILHPFWNARLAIELQSAQTRIDGWPQYRGALNYVIRTIAQPGGLRASFRGLSVSMSAVSHHTLLMVIYDKLSTLKLPTYLKKAEKVQPFVNGMISRLVPTLVCYPLYVMRVMQQCHNTEVTRYSISRIIFWNYKKNRIKGMYSGLPVQLLRSTLSGGIMFTIYEALLTLSSKLIIHLLNIILSY
ncbi:mitochondrial carrier protein [Theileria orientalis]|uniref:Mitochondrial carrier protein n=1 Tax=Theileria orientalis TaxID=68886 RepID=A0A976QU15_THEOR|nr:mitochondrial carrier protein [Theileria orientalis]